MQVFPAEVPGPEAPRSDVVEVRVARKVAPLFGVPVESGPFGRRSWVCDFTALSLAELGRGAPSPDRAAQSTLDGEYAAGAGDGGVGAAREWAWAGRAVWTPGRAPTPGALTNATLNRFGPDTKAAAVLTGANRLLRGPAAAVGAVCRSLASSGCDPEIRLAVWAGLVLEVYRAQPALVVAAVQARLVQRSLSARWGDHVDPAGVTATGAPSEIGPGPAAADVPDGATPNRPTRFGLVDETLPLLGLAEETATGTGLVTRDALDDIASAWCRRLLAIGRPGRGLVWLADDADGSRRAFAMVRVGAVVAPFVAAALGGALERTATPAPPRPPVLPALPAVGPAAAVEPGAVEPAAVEPAAAGTDRVTRHRAHLLAAHVAANYVRYRDDLLLAWPGLRAASRRLVEDAARGSAATLGPADPVTVQLDGYAAYLDLWDRQRSPGACRDDPACAAAVTRLLAAERTVTDAWRAGRLDPGAASYLLEIAAVALAEAAGGVREDRAATRARWSAILASRGLDPGTDPAARADSLSASQVFHLQHYAAALARGGGRADLRRALTLQERVAEVRAEVIRREPAGFAAKSTAARGAHELAAAIACDLAEATPAREHAARARTLRSAVDHAHAVLTDPSTPGLLLPAGGHPVTRRAARAVARALVLAAGHGHAPDPADRDAAVALLDAALAPGGDHERPEDHDLRTWRAALAGAVPADPAQSPNPPSQR